MNTSIEKIVLTVCKGNIHRSVIAAACIDKLLQERGLHSAIGVQSRGLQGSFGTTPPRFPSIRDYPDEWELTRPGLEHLGIEIPTDQTATSITKADVENADLILALDKAVMQTLLDHFGDEISSLQSKMMLFMELGGVSADVPDCGGKKDPVMFQEVASMIYLTVEENLNELLRRIGCL